MSVRTQARRSHADHFVLVPCIHLAFKSDGLRFFQKWKHSRAFANPFSWPMLPNSAPEILNAWRTSRNQRQLLNNSWLQAMHLDQYCDLVPEVRWRWSFFSGNMSDLGHSPSMR